jgi:hypothetical protein
MLSALCSTPSPPNYQVTEKFIDAADGGFAMPTAAKTQLSWRSRDEVPFFAPKALCKPTPYPINQTSSMASSMLWKESMFSFASLHFTPGVSHKSAVN